MCHHQGIELYALVVLSSCQGRTLLTSLTVTAVVGLLDEFNFDRRIVLLYLYYLYII